MFVIKYQDMKSLKLILFVVVILSCKREKEVAPVASFTYEANELTVSFTSASTNNPTSWDWDFGDNNTGTGSTVAHTFASDGDYIVKLTAKNEAGEHSETQTIHVEKLYSLVEIKTSFGAMIMWLYNQTINHKNNFIQLAESGFYDSTTFHRIIDNFVIQGGDPNTKDADPNNDGTGGPGYEIDAEFVDSLTHIFGAVGAARDADAVNPEKKSNGSQFYIVEHTNGTHFLDNNYTVFGLIIDGMDVASQIAIQPKDGNDRPIENIIMDVNIIKLSETEIASQYNFNVNSQKAL